MNKFRNVLKPKTVLASFAAVLVAALSWGVLANSTVRAAQDYTNNAIIHGGCTSVSDCVNKIKSNAKGDLDNIYNRMGLQQSEISRFEKTAQKVTIYKDGRIVLADGTVIATDTTSYGRERVGANRSTITIDGKTYFHSKVKDSLQVQSTTGFAMINPDDHSMEFAIMTACGNPITGTSPAYKCNSLTKTKVSDDTYDFSASTYAKNANLTKLVYEFGDGSKKEVTSNFTQKVRHTYKPGKFTAKVTAHFNVNGKTKTHTTAQCTTPVEVPEKPKPVFACAALTMVVKNKEEREYTFTVTSTQANGPVLATADFTFGDGQTQNGVKANADKKSATVTHKYSKNLEGDIKVKATVKSDTGLTSTSTPCEVKLSFKKDIVYCKPGIPVGDERCNDYCKPGIPVGDERCKDYCKPGIEVGSPECEEKEECKPGVPVGSKECEETPAELPSTGPTEIIVGTLGMGTMVAAASYYRSSRRNLLDILNR